MRKVGKRMVGKIYAHRNYEDEVVPADLLARAKEIFNQSFDLDYVCIRFDTKSRVVAFQCSPDFNESDEPIVGDTVSIYPDKDEVKLTPQKNNPQIWHRKYLWVKDDYKGFDVDESKRRAELYDAHLTKYDKSRIGYLSYWNRFKKRVGIE